MTTKRLQSLIDFAQYVEFKNQYKLVDVEDEICEDRKVVKIKEDEYNEKAHKFILLTSLPFTLSKNNVDIEDMWDEPLECSYCESIDHENKCLPRGNIHADYMVVGDIPWSKRNYSYFDRVQSLNGSSELIRKALAYIGILEDCWFTNLVNCNTQAYRKPNMEEASDCFPFLKKEIDIIQPKTIITLGSSVKKFLNDKIGDEIKVISISHPILQLRRATDFKEYSEHIWDRIEGNEEEEESDE